MVAVLAILHISYALCYWGSTLLGGGPGGTGSWPFLYTLTGLGPGPNPAGPGQGSNAPGGGNAISSGPGIFGLPAIPGITTGIGVQYCTGPLSVYTPPGGFQGFRLPQDWVWQMCGGPVGQVSRDCVRMFGYDCAQHSG